LSGKKVHKTFYLQAWCLLNSVYKTSRQSVHIFHDYNIQDKKYEYEKERHNEKPKK
jgi:hypothetical protein